METASNPHRNPGTAVTLTLMFHRDPPARTCRSHLVTESCSHVTSRDSPFTEIYSLNIHIYTCYEPSQTLAMNHFLFWLKLACVLK